MAGFRPSQVVIGIAGELVKGFTTTHYPGAQAAGRADHRRRAAEAHRRRAARGAARRRAGHHLGDRPAQRGRAAGPCGGHGRVHRRLRGHQPGRLPGPPRAHQHLQRLRPAGPPGRAAERGQRSSTWSCWRSWPSRTPWPACWAASRCRRPAPCSSTSAAGTTDVALVRQGGIEGTRMFALGGRAFTKSLADRLDLPFSRAEADQGRLRPRPARRGRQDGRARSWPRTRPSGRPAWSWCSRSSAGGDLLPGRIDVCGGGSRLANLVEALRDERFAERLPFSRPPEVSIMEPGEIEAIARRDQAARRPAGRDPARPGLPGHRDGLAGAAARCGPAPRAAGDEGLGVPVRLVGRDDDRLPRPGRRDHQCRRAPAGQRRHARCPRPAARLAHRHEPHQLPPAGPRGAGAPAAPVHRGRGARRARRWRSRPACPPTARWPTTRPPSPRAGRRRGRSPQGPQGPQRPQGRQAWLWPRARATRI